MPDLFKPYRQFDSDNDTRRSDCAPNASLWALRWQTRGAIRPEGRAEIDEALRKLRNRSDPKKPQGAITIREMQVGYESFGAQFANRNPMLKMRLGKRVEDVLWPKLTEGRAALVYVNYGVINRRRPDLSGSMDFNKGHAVIAIDGRGQGDDRMVTVADPTRRELQTWPWWLLKRSTGLFGKTPWGIGKGEYAIIVRVSLPNEPEPPDPPDPPDPPLSPEELKIQELKDRIDSLRAEIKALKAELATRAGKTEALRELVAQLEAALAKAEAGDPPANFDSLLEERLPEDPGSSRFGRPADEPGDEEIDEGAEQDEETINRSGATP
jgi:hypothetical protein